MGHILIYSIILVIFLTGCSEIGEDGINKSTIKDYQSVDINNSTLILNGSENIIIQNDTIAPIIQKNTNKYRLSSFYIDNLGESKVNNPHISQEIIGVLLSNDIIAVQGIDIEEKISFNNLMEKVLNYEYIIGKKLAFVYNNKILVSRPTEYEDVKDNFLINPYMAEFKTNNFEFVLIQVEIEKFDATNEIKHLADVVKFAEDHYLNNNIFIVGNMKSDAIYFDEEGDYLEEYQVLIGNEIDTTTDRNNRTYDRILTIKEYGTILNNCSVDIYTNNFDLAQAVSSSYPIGCDLNV